MQIKNSHIEYLDFAIYNFGFENCFTNTLIKGYGLGCVLLVRPPPWMSCFFLAAFWPCMRARAGIPENLQDSCPSASNSSGKSYDSPIPNKPSKPGPVAKQRASQTRMYGSFFMRGLSKISEMTTIEKLIACCMPVA